MNDDIVTRLRNWHTDHDSAVPRPIDLEAADEIERLRKMAYKLYEETKRCGSLHDTPATMDYEEWLEEND